MTLSASLRTVLARHDPVSLVDPLTTPLQITQIHAHLLTAGHLADPRLLGKLISALLLPRPTPDRILYSHRLLSHSLHPPTLFSLNSLIRAHCKSATPLHSFRFYNHILRSDRLSPDNFTFTFLVRACAQVPCPKPGSAVHCAALKRGFACDGHVQSGLVHMYAELGQADAFRRVYSEMKDPDLVCRTAMVSACAASGELEFAREMFDEMPDRDAIAWNAMIAGYAHVGRSREALDLFHLMQCESVKVDEATMVSVLSACAHLGALDQGKWAHVFIERNAIRMTVTLGTALIDMYSKCGDLERSMDLFWKMRERNVYTWSSVMNGLAMNGSSGRCLELYELMKKDGVLPNAVTFVSVLRACSVAGLVFKGREIFESMKRDYSIDPWPEHYGCMVDMYGRAGQLNDAVNFIKAMPIKPHLEAWGALLHSCRIHGNKELGEYALGKIIEMQHKHDGAHVLLSNIYAESRYWDGVKRVRELMKIKGVRKEPGCSAIEVEGEVHEFFVGCKSHPRYKEIEVMLGEMSRRMKLAGYVAKTDQVLFDIEEEEKEDALGWHSEKLAIAFGLLSLKEGVIIRVVKNLRVCWDCHEATKILAKVFNREIVVRDRNRFHHFKGGTCSCRDFW